MEDGSTAIPITLALIYRAIVEVKVVSDSLDVRLKALTDSVHRLEIEVGILKDWRATQANNAIKQVSDNRVDLAKMGAIGGGFGIVAVVLGAVLKALGVF